MLVGFFIMIVGIAIVLLSAFSSFKRGKKSEGGGVILIGPIPIIFGSNRKLLIITTVGFLVLVITTVVFFLI